MLRYGEGPVTLLPTDEPSDHRGAANGVGTPVTIGRLAPAVTDHDRDPNLQTGSHLKKQATPTEEASDPDSTDRPYPRRGQLSR